MTFEEAWKLVEQGKLPADSELWELADQDDWTLAHEAARNGLLPEGFSQWGITCGGISQSVAHVAVEARVYPDHLPIEELTNTDIFGDTAAHYAIQSGHRLPAEFNHWEMADEEGWTVAHAAAEHDLLPEDFTQWHLTDDFGQTVEDIARKAGVDMSKFKMFQLDVVIRNALEQTEKTERQIGI